MIISRVLVVATGLKTIRMMFQLMPKQRNAAQQILKADGSEKVNISMCLPMELKLHVIEMDGL